jgi:hypothetical protein
MPEVGARLLEPIPRMAGVARIIRYQAKGFDGSGLPADEVRGEAIPLGARILKVLWDFSELEEARKSRLVAMEELRLRPKAYDPKVLAALAESLTASRPVAVVSSHRLRELRTGMILAEAIRAADGSLVLPTGLRLGPGHLELLASLTRLLELQDPVSILVAVEAPHEA